MSVAASLVSPCSAVPALPKSASQRSSLAHQAFKLTRARYLHRREVDNLSSEGFNGLARHLEALGVTSVHGVRQLSCDDIRSLLQAVPQLRALFLRSEMSTLLSPAAGGVSRSDIASVRSKRMSHVFFALQKAACISSTEFLNQTAQSVNFNQLSVLLSSYDASGSRSLTEYELESFVFDQVPVLPQLDGIEDEFVTFYVYGAVRKFFFSLDPSRRGRINISKLMRSEVFREFEELRKERDEPLDTEAFPFNWFSLECAHRTYDSYVCLDDDGDGMLSKSEFSRFSNGSLSKLFVDRVFEEYRTFDGLMDYKTFLDFMLAATYKQSTSSMIFYWRIFDLQRRGYLTRFEVHAFLKDIWSKVLNGKQQLYFSEAPRDTMVVMNELFDVFAIQHEDRILRNEVMSSGHGGVLSEMLSNSENFIKFDNQESFLSPIVPIPPGGFEPPAPASSSEQPYFSTSSESQDGSNSTTSDYAPSSIFSGSPPSGASDQSKHPQSPSCEATNFDDSENRPPTTTRGAVGTVEAASPITLTLDLPVLTSATQFSLPEKSVSK